MRIFSIILADDEQQILYGMKKGIEWEKLGFRVAGVAQNGKEALELMEEVHPDLVISDIKMPFMDGLELAKHIHEDYMNTKVILFSGWDDFEYARLAISYGVSEYIMKPINYEEMQNLLMKMHEELDKEYNEKMNRARLEHAYMESLPLLRQQFFTRLVTEKMNKNELQSQIDNLKLEFTDAVYSVVAMKVGRGDEKDVLSELAVKQTIKEALEKITRVYEFGMSDNEIFILGSNKKHDVGRITRTIDEAVVLIERIFQSRSSYFSKIFKQETGGTFVNYLTGRRMEEAKKLLLQTDYKSQVIGNMVGYPEPNYFSYVFKKNCGMSPVKYRKQGGDADEG